MMVKLKVSMFQGKNLEVPKNLCKQKVQGKDAKFIWEIREANKKRIMRKSLMNNANHVL